ncbi:MAG: FHA domain-containing protein [Chthoniobacteraceae bacterium]
MEDYDKTRLIRRSSSQPPPPPPPIPSSASRAASDDSDKTRILPRPASPEPERRESGPSIPSDDKTVIVTPPMRARMGLGEAATIPGDPMTDPVVGWIVVVAGPGQGNTLKLGHGMNSIGRSEGQRCRLDFGDTEISRNSHATLTYDPRGRKFYLMHGGGQNLTYLGDIPVLQPTLLKGGELISLGKTTLKFIALCGPDFDWSQQNAPTA